MEDAGHTRVPQPYTECHGEGGLDISESARLEEAVELGGVWPRLQQRLVVDRDGRVRVLETNECLCIGGRTLSAFESVDENTSGLLRLDRLQSVSRAPYRIGLVLLAAGLNTRGGGAVHPLCRVGSRGTLLQCHLNRHLGKKPPDLTLIHCQPGALEKIAAHVGDRAVAYSGGWIPRLAMRQLNLDSLTASTPASFNPGGHLDALRWLVISGLFRRAMSLDVLVFASMTNVSNVLDDSDRIVHCLMEQDRLALVEVTGRPQDKMTGSRLVRDGGAFRLIKLAYGTGRPGLTGDTVLMSTNTWWVRVDKMVSRLSHHAGGVGLTQLLSDARKGDSRRSAADCFDSAFPVDPHLSVKHVNGGDVLQAERDIDQLTFVTRDLIVPLVVDRGRGVSVKQIETLNSPHIINTYLG